MNITIAERLQLFSHTPGSSCLIPGTTWRIQAFPVCFVVTSEAGDKHTFSLPLNGPVTGFTLLQDLEHGHVAIFGTWQEGFFFWQIESKENALWLSLKRTPESGCTILMDKKAYPLRRADTVRIATIHEGAPKSSAERLSFGNHKKQEWESIHRRMNMCEILPIWFRLGQLLPPLAVGKNSLFPTPTCKEEWPEALQRLFRAHFRNMFIPTLEDELHQGLITRALSADSSPLLFLQEGARVIRNLFFREESAGYALLPALPSPWHCGRFTGIQSSTGDRFDLEWSKKQIRRVIVYPALSHSITLSFPSAIKSFRVRTSLLSKGQRQENKSLLTLVANTPLYLDRFEK